MPGSIQPNSLFHPQGPWLEIFPPITIPPIPPTHVHFVVEAMVPEPGTLTMSGTAMLIMAGYAARSRKKAHSR